MQSFLKHNPSRFANAKIKALPFAMFINRVFDKMYVIKNFGRFSWIATGA
jgi:hypothetical protein